MTRHVHDHLSAYMDGESPHPERIAAHLAECEECAHHHAQLLDQSRRVRTLEMPDVRPEFTTRVMAHIREIEPAPPRAWRHEISITVAAASIALAVACVWLLRTDDRQNPEWPGAAPEQGWSAADNSLGVDDLNAITDWTADDVSLSTDLVAELVEPLADTSWSTPLVEAWGPREDLDGLLLRLNDEEQANFRALLWLYAQDSDLI